MKKNLLFSSIIIGGAMSAQITLTQANHAPASADSYTMKTVGTATVSPGASGTAVMWNMSGMTVSTTVTSYSASTSSNVSYTPANIVVNNSSSESAYYQSSTSNLKYFGGNINIGSIPATITYTTGAFYAVYPMSLGTNTVASISGTLSAFTNTGTFTGSCATIADGTGTLMLPSGLTYTNVLRVLNTQTINFAVPAAFITSGVLNQDSYNYYIPGRKSPVLTIVTSTAVAPPIASAPTSQTITTIAADILTQLNEMSSKITDLSVFPNPSINYINLTTQSNNAAIVEVYDLTGKKIETHTFNNGQVGFKTCCLAPGVYIYEVKDNNKVTLTGGKFSVVH